MVVPAAFLLSGCYTYVPAELATVPAGQEVRIYLSRGALAALPEEIPANGMSVRGTLVGQEADSLAVGVRVSTRQPGLMMEDLRQVVKVGTGEVMDVQRREFSGSRTALLMAGAAGAAAGVLTLIASARGDSGLGDPNDEVSRVPLFSLPLRLLPGR